MRLIYTTQDSETGSRLSHFLRREGIANELEIVGSQDWGSAEYGTVTNRIWVIDEDQFVAAQKWVEEFKNHPENPIFQSDVKAPLLDLGTEPLATNGPKKRGRRGKKKVEKGMGIITLYLLTFCTLLFLYGELTSPAATPPYPQLPLTPLYSPPINKLLYFDYPEAYEMIDQLDKAYGIEKLRNLDELPNDGKILVQKYQKTPYWKGFYDQMVAYFSTPSVPFAINAPLFEKIQLGEVWRLVTPALLHQNLLHLFFNMIWLVVLGKLMEERLGAMQFALFILITAVISNTSQYLMSGANFIGISGVITAMVGFIFARQQLAPWEGYNLNPGVLSFMFFFIAAMVGLQVTSFLLEIFLKESFIPGIANTAHVAGLISGYLLGLTPFFSVRRSL